MRQHVEQDIPNLREKAPLLSEEFSALIVSCLQKDPALRPPTARALSDSLRALEPGGPVWTRREAEDWWDKHRPRREILRPNYTQVPLRDVEIVPPKAAPSEPGSRV